MKNSFEVLLLWINRIFKKNQDELLAKMDTKMETIQNLFKTSAEATVSPSDMLEGQTAYNGTVLITGNMKNRQGVTVDASAVQQDENYTFLTIPEKACYDAKSKVRVLNSDIKVKRAYLGQYVTYTSHSFNVSSYPNYKNFTAENFALVPFEIYYGQPGEGEFYGNIQYDATTGIVTFPRLFRYKEEVYGTAMYCRCYLFY